MPEWSQVVIASSTLLFALTLSITTILHETAHALVGRMFGDHPVLHHTFVEHQALAPRERVVTAAAGPVFSLLQGIAFAALCLVGPESAMLQLFALWMAIHGLVNFFGYLITVPFARQADLGKVADYLELTTAARFVICGIGFLAQIAIGVVVTRLFLRLAPSSEILITEWGRRSFILYVAVFPWALGSIISVLTRIPSPQWVNLLYPLLSGSFSLVTLSRASSEVTTRVIGGAWDNVKLGPWIAALMVILIVFRLVLARGIRFDNS